MLQLVLPLALLLPQTAAAKTEGVAFKSHDGYEMFGKLTLPAGATKHPVVIYVQTAEGMTVDMKRALGATKTFNYFDLYRTKLPEMGVGFFSYEGRGIKMGEVGPRFEAIDPAVYDTSTLENKVRDVLSAIDAVRSKTGVDSDRIFLMGASEGTLLAAEAASRAPKNVAGLILYAVMSNTMKETFRYINTGGALVNYCAYFDTDKDGKISKAEFEADPAKYRESVWRNADFNVFDKDNDGFFTAADMAVLAKPMLDAIDKNDFTVLDAWTKTSAAVATPKGWFKDHFEHKQIWTFLEKLDMPVGFFQGDRDAMVPIEGVRGLEAAAKKAGKSRMQFHYFPGLDHSLRIGTYFINGTIPAGHQAIFEFIRSLTSHE